MSSFENAINPFDEDDTINTIQGVCETVVSESAVPVSDQVGPRADSLGFDAIANKLIEERLYLSALELHIELMESGRELVKLRDFFSNPANFERSTNTLRSGMSVLGENSPPRLTRAASIQTFDSLDFARSSDDGERNDNDRIAVLEFELRKSHETIRSLRAALTRTAAATVSVESVADAEQTSSVSVSSKLPTIDEPARPHERHALNFLINEYLLRHDYKLTSVTFSEENPNQDFDDWDDVGINIAKPPDLLRMYRDGLFPRAGNGPTKSDVEKCDFTCMVDLSESATTEVDAVRLELEKRLSNLENQIRALEAENQQLSAMLEVADKKDSHSFVDHSTPVPSPVRRLAQPISIDGNAGGLHEEGSEESLQKGKSHVDEESDDKMSGEECEARVESTPELPTDITDGVERTTDALQANSDAVTDASDSLTEQVSKLAAVASEVPTWKSSENYKRALLGAVFQVLPDNRIYNEVSLIAGENDSTFTDVIPLLARCLPHIVPNVLLAARDELIPLIVCAAALHADSKTRDQLLSVLFNLIKRPDQDQRRMILVGCVAFARHAGAARVESELLPQCWEQIGHKHIERRLLVAEACGALTPHVPPELRGSLLFSMLQQMLEDSSEDIREAAVRSLGVLVGFLQDTDKYGLIESLFFSCFGDISERVLAAVHQVFLPSLAVWTMDFSRLETSFIAAIIGRIQKQVESSKITSVHSQTASGITISDQNHFCRLIGALCELIPVLFGWCLSRAPFALEAINQSSDDHVTTSMTITSVSKPACELLDLQVIFGEELIAKLISAYELYTSEEWYQPWSTYTWVANELVSQLVSVAESIDPSDQLVVRALITIFRSICATFGSNFSKKVVRVRFLKNLHIPPVESAEMTLMEHASLIRCTAPVYVVGVLAAFSLDSDRTELSQFLSAFIQSAALHKCSLVAVYATVTELCIVSETSTTGLPDLLLSVLWDCVMNQSSLVRTAAANCFEPAVRAGGISEQQISSRIVPALVTLAGDSCPDVRAASVGALGAVIECVSGRTILDKVYMQFQTLMDDPAYRDEHALTVGLIRSIGKAGPSAEPRFRDDFILPRLAALAARNSTATTEPAVRRTEVALALFEAYSSVSCCFFGSQLISGVFLPGLRCLQGDLQQLSADHATVVGSMIREFEDRLDTVATNTGSSSSSAVVSAAANGSSSVASAAVSAAGGQPAAGDAIKSKMLSHIKDVKDRASYSNLALSKIFSPNSKK